jgi:hypothetical protein
MRRQFFMATIALAAAWMVPAQLAAAETAANDAGATADVSFQFEREFASLRERNRRDPRASDYDRLLGMQFAEAMDEATRQCGAKAQSPHRFRAILRIAADGGYRMDFAPITGFSVCFVAAVEKAVAKVPVPPAGLTAHPFSYDFSAAPPSANP